MTSKESKSTATRIVHGQSPRIDTMRQAVVALREENEKQYQVILKLKTRLKKLERLANEAQEF